ncbi:MAG TPA: tetratricopeptide repeat protein [Planctomycetaceae bacterium]|nr:tetratricopeptide repeat protein [Planctomycetaceae bacterium]
MAAAPQPDTHSSPDPAAARRRFRRRIVAFVAVGAVLLAVFAVGPLAKLLARRELAIRRPQAALWWLELGSRFRSNDPEIEFLQARAARKEARWDLVQQHLRRAYDLGYDRGKIEREQWFASAQSGNLRTSLPHLPQLLTDPQGDGQEICEAFVSGYFLNHRLSEAVELIDAWIADYPRDPLPWQIRGKIRKESAFLKDAEADFRHAVELSPSEGEYSLNLADVLLEQREYVAAEQAFRQAARDARYVRPARIGEAECLRKQGKLEGARECVQSVLSKDPHSREALAELGQIELQAGKFADAVAPLQKAYEANPRSIAVRQALGRALAGAGRRPEAQVHLKYVEQAQAALAQAEKLVDYVSRHPQDAQKRYEIGKIYLEYAVPERGISWLQSAVNCDPHHRASHAALADYYEQHAAENPAFADAAKQHRAAAEGAKPSERAATDVDPP